MQIIPFFFVLFRQLVIYLAKETERLKHKTRSEE